MSNEKSHKIDAIKYFVPLPEGDYDFQEHLTDYLLTDILNTNKQLEKYEARVKELEEKLKRKTQECESLKEEIEVLKDNFDTATRDCNELIEELKQECEELKEENQQLRNNLSDSLMFRFTSQDKQINRYRKALEEIEEYIKEEEWSLLDYVIRDINDIINKAKGEGKCNMKI